jgi:hypothetical protein
MHNTQLQFAQILHQCRELFEKKLSDYGAAWRVLRPSSITDQIYIKVNRIRTLQMTEVQMIDESEESEFIAIVNYSIIGLIQLEKGFSENLDENPKEILRFLCKRSDRINAEKKPRLRRSVARNAHFFDHRSDLSKSITYETD